MAYLLILLTISFAEKFLILMKSNLSIISFMDHAFDVVSKKAGRFSSRSFIVLYFALRSMIYFEVIFVKGVSSGPRFFFLLHVNV